MAIELSPCVDQTPAEIGKYYRSVEVGSLAVVRHTQYGLLHYAVATIQGTNPRRGRVYVDQHGAFYVKSGTNCFHPKGQTTLVVPTEAVMNWVQANPRGKTGVSIFRPIRLHPPPMSEG